VFNIPAQTCTLSCGFSSKPIAAPACSLSPSRIKRKAAQSIAFIPPLTVVFMESFRSFFKSHLAQSKTLQLRLPSSTSRRPHHNPAQEIPGKLQTLYCSCHLYSPPLCAGSESAPMISARQGSDSLPLMAWKDPSSAATRCSYNHSACICFSNLSAPS
jgi:hypothetical protein